MSLEERYKELFEFLIEKHMEKNGTSYNDARDKAIDAVTELNKLLEDRTIAGYEIDRENSRLVLKAHTFESVLEEFETMGKGDVISLDEIEKKISSETFIEDRKDYKVSIFSLDKKAYWKPDAIGYTEDINSAGIFYLDDAYKLSRLGYPYVKVEYIVLNT